jgi:delta 1-pyrroline-5-carboxylate dehydrogenase
MLNRMAIPPEERIRQLCSLLSVAEGADLENAIAELRSAIRELVDDVRNVSTYNLIKFPSALDKQKKA